jgi:hypothetical protein
MGLCRWLRRRCGVGCGRLFPKINCWRRDNASARQSWSRSSAPSNCTTSSFRATSHRTRQFSAVRRRHHQHSSEMRSLASGPTRTSSECVTCVLPRKVPHPHSLHCHCGRPSRRPSRSSSRRAVHARMRPTSRRPRPPTTALCASPLRAVNQQVHRRPRAQAWARMGAPRQRTGAWAPRIRASLPTSYARARIKCKGRAIFNRADAMAIHFSLL